jgi:hypothetical protein
MASEHDLDSTTGAGAFEKSAGFLAQKAVTLSRRV